MLVIKFGGTSMGSASSITGNVAPIIETAAKKGLQPLVVVSAMSGVTNLLLKAAQTAAGQKRIDEEALGSLREMNLEVIDTLKPNAHIHERAMNCLEGELENLKSFLRAITVIGELSFASHDAIIAVGEKLSAMMMAAVLNVRGFKSEYVNLQTLIPAKLRYESDRYWDEIEVLMWKRIQEVEPKSIPVLTGFFGQTANGILQDVGRGYSDFCASVAGAAVRSSEIQIWTDVDGVLSANPKVVPEAFILDQVSFDEIAELSHFGAKVLHPFSVRPAYLAGIPIRILNTFNPSCPGTIITKEGGDLHIPFKSVTYKQGITVIDITTPKMLMAHGYMAKVTGVFGKHAVSIDLITTSEVSVSVTVEGKVDPESRFYRDLREHGDVALIEGQSVISIVGSEMRNNQAVWGRALEVLQANGIGIKMVSLSCSLINLSVVVNDGDCEKAVRLLHGEFFQS